MRDLSQGFRDARGIRPSPVLRLPKVKNNINIRDLVGLVMIPTLAATLVCFGFWFASALVTEKVTNDFSFDLDCHL